MATILLDFGSGNTCKNDQKIVARMYDELADIDTRKHNVIVKWQLFKKAGDNVPLDQRAFDFACLYGQKKGYQTTASVFDLLSLKFLLQYDVPLIKIANRRDLDWLIGEVPRRVPVYVSCGTCYEAARILCKDNVRVLMCVSKYPAAKKDYDDVIGALTTAEPFLSGVPFGFGISDHTTNFSLWEEYRPEIIEWHYKLEDSTGLDAGPFARTPAQLKEIL